MTDRVIRVVVDPSGVTRGAGQAGRGLDGLERKSKGVSTGFKAAAAAATAFAASIAVREIFQAVDAYQSLQNRLRIVTDSSEQLAAIQGELFEISQNTRTSFEATAELFGRTAIAADELGASQEQLLRLTEISGKALAIQGSSAQEASGALRQLSQSFSSGIVRAEEFNSILEGAFPIAQAAARGIDEAGGSVGKLRNLVIEGKVSSTEFFEAILKGGEEIDDQFGQTTVTLSQGITTIKNSFLNLVGQLNDTTGAGASVAEVLVGISDTLDDLALALTGTLQPGDELSEEFKVLTTGAILFTKSAGVLADVLIGNVTTAFNIVGETIGATAAGLVSFAKGDFALAAGVFEELGDSISEQFTENFVNITEAVESSTSEALELITEIWDAGARDIIDTQDTITTNAGKVKVIDPNASEDIADATEAVLEFQAALNEQTTVLALQAALGDDAAEAIKDFKAQTELAAAANEIFGELVPTEEVNQLREAFVQYGQEALAAQQALREEIENQAVSEAFDEQIADLQLEIELLGADNEALALNAEARALADGATIEQAANIRKLTEELLNGQDSLSDASESLDEFYTDAAQSAENLLGNALADPLSGGLDELPFKFAETLNQLAAQALSAEVFEILAGLGGGAGGGGAGGAVGLFAGLFGGAAAGGQVQGGKPIMVGERGPELFTPPGSGAIQPNVNINQAAQAAPSVTINNITDPQDIPAGLNNAAGDEAIMNSIQRNPEAVKRVLGG